MENQYKIIFDENSTQWSKDEKYNLAYLKTQENFFNDMLKARGHLFLNEIHDALGVKRTSEGAISGWLYENESNLVVFDMHLEENQIIIGLNPDGIVFNKI